MCVWPPLYFYTHTTCLKHTAMGSRSCLLLLLFLVHAALGQICTPDPCKTDCKDCVDDEKVADPEDCHSYYVCDGKDDLKYPQPFKCSNGEVYDASVHQCISGTTCTPCPRCFYDCGSSTNDIISFPTNCNLYALCLGGFPGPAQPCSIDLPFFDGYRCQADQTRCCSCHAYCYSSQVGTLIADPMDCRNFYGCDNVGEPNMSGTCPSGQYFDDYFHNCSPYAPCNTMCKNVVGSDGCIELYTCVEKGYFPKCPSLCRPEYYHCTEITDIYIDPDSCPVGYVFHPDSHVCVTGNSCP